MLRRLSPLVLIAALAVGIDRSAAAQDMLPERAPTPAVLRISPPPCPQSFAGTKQLPSFATERVIAQKKKAWEQSVGGEQAAVPFIKDRLRGWPRQLIIDAKSLPENDREFAWRIARDTWRGIDAMTDRENGLPIDGLRFPGGSVNISSARVGDYASGANIGLYLMSVVSARDLGFITPADADTRIRGVLITLRTLEHYQGFPYNFYDTTSLERTSNFVSFVDAAWLTAGLIVVRNAVPDLYELCTDFIEEASYRFFWDEGAALVSHGYYVNAGVSSPYHYGVLYTEARLGILIGIGLQQIPESAWFRMVRTYPAACAGQHLTTVDERRKRIGAYEITAGFTQWNDIRYIPSWGGSMFEALMPALVLDEQRLAPASLGANDVAHVAVQRRYASEELGLPVWGFSPAATPDGAGYAEYGVRVLGASGYASDAVTPHASALALAVDAPAALANLRTLANRYDIYGDFGFYDAVDPRAGRVARAYLSFDQSMMFLALGNYLSTTNAQRWFTVDPIIQRVLPLIRDESFFD
jgi:hypothetical protein